MGKEHIGNGHFLLFWLKSFGFSISSAQVILVQGVARYVEMVRNSELSKSDPKYKPLHFDKAYNRLGRKLKNYLEKSFFFTCPIKTGIYIYILKCIIVN